MWEAVMRLPSTSTKLIHGWTGLLLSLAFCFGSDALTCEEARLKCAYREGCGMAMQNFLISCSNLHQFNKTCPEQCQHSLIALMSTDEGQQFMSCDCTDQYCFETKERVEVCRPQVLKATMNETIVSCTVAHWICSADTLCSMAFQFYHSNCRSMFLGKRCTSRCENSINILRRQDKAAKLQTCVCSGREGYDCLTIRKNMDTMCFVKKSQQHGSKPEPPPPSVHADDNILTNEIGPRRQTSGADGMKIVSHHLTLLLLLLTLWI